MEIVANEVKSVHVRAGGLGFYFYKDRFGLVILDHTGDEQLCWIPSDYLLNDQFMKEILAEDLEGHDLDELMDLIKRALPLIS